MNKIILFFGFVLSMNLTIAQETSIDSVMQGKVTVVKDERIDLLGKKMAEYNESLANKIHMVKGYRLMLLSTTDRTQAISVRSQLLKQYPDQGVYMTFQSPYIKLKFGNFIEKEEADKMRKQLSSSGIITGNIYLVPEMVEVKPDKTKQPEE